MTRPLRISVVTPSLNQVDFVGRAVESVLSQTGPFELEYLVRDGGSTDGSVAVLERYADRLKLHVGPDRGQANAVNAGLREATGEIVGWLNSDDLLYPGALAEAAEVFRSRPDVQWLHGRCEVIDPHDRPIRRPISAYKDWRARRYSFRELLLENFVSQMTVFWRRAALERVGLLDESLHYTFDYDLWLRLAKLSDPAYVPRRLAAFRWYPQTKSGSSFERQFAEDYEVFLRHAPDDRGLRARKRLRTARILWVYRALAALRAG